MDLQIIDTSFGTHHLSQRLTRSAHTLTPRAGKAARETVLQAVIVNAPLEKDSHASVSVLDDHYAWTQLLSLPASEWRPGVPLPDRANTAKGEDTLTALADDLLARAVRILSA